MSITIEIVPDSPADQKEWDSFVLAHSGGSPYQLIAWGQAIRQAYGHKLFFLMARRGDRLVGILSLVHLKLSFIVNELVALPYCDVGNCLTADSAVEKKLLVEAQKFSKPLKTKYMQLRGSLLDEIDSDTSFTRLEINKVRMLLELPESSEALFEKFKPKLRSQIRKAEKNGVSFRWTGKDGVASFYSVFCNNMRILGSPVHSRKWFSSIMEQFGDKAGIGLVEYEGKCIGAGLILSTNEQTAVPWASTLRQYNHLAPNMLLYWNLLKFAADNGKNTFDFGRSTENDGTFNFKKQWGAKPMPLSWYATCPDDQVLITANKTNSVRREKVAEIWKKIPLPIANFFGPHLRKYINL